LVTSVPLALSFMISTVRPFVSHSDTIPEIRESLKEWFGEKSKFINEKNEFSVLKLV